MFHDRALLPQDPGRVQDGTAAGHDVLDEHDPQALDYPALGGPTGAVLFGLLADEPSRHSRPLGQQGDQRDTTELKTGQHVSVRGQQRTHRVDDPGEQRRVSLEQILVEVLAARPPGTQQKQTGQMRHGPDAGGKRAGVSHVCGLYRSGRWFRPQQRPKPPTASATEAGA